MIPLWILKNKQILQGLLALGALLLCFWLLMNYGHEQYVKGQIAERDVWTQAMEIAQQRARGAEEALASDRAQREKEAAATATQRTTLVQTTRTQIHEAPDLESRLAALAALRERLQHDDAENFARARANYLSGIPT